MTHIKALCGACLLGTALAACSGDPDDTRSAASQEVRILIHAPAPAKTGKTLPGDPGLEVDEGAEWDRLTLFFAYEGPAEVYRKTWSRKDFTDAEENPGEDTGRKQLTMTVRTGAARVLGLTYNEQDAQAAGLTERIKACRNLQDVLALTIPNNYTAMSTGAVMDKARFVSVATGYVAQDGGTGLGTVEVTATEDGKAQLQPVANLTLKRLATKIDIQYAADDSYNGHYTEVSVPQFTFYGTTEGYLFPALNAGKRLQADGAGVTFVNTTPISQLNGRVYHYTFTDGASPADGGQAAVPYVAFSIQAKDNHDGGAVVERTYNLQFPALEQAAWYKGNLKLQGFETADGTVIRINPNPADEP